MCKIEETFLESRPGESPSCFNDGTPNFSPIDAGFREPSLEARDDDSLERRVAARLHF